MPRIQCPKCGSETAKILWGMPAWSEKLKKDVDEKKIYLGGCDMMVPPPSRYCFNCEEGVCYTFFPVDEAETRTIEFEVGGFHEGFSKIEVMKNEEGFVANYYPPFSMDIPGKSLQLNKEQFEKYVHKIYMTYIKEWEEEYTNPDILDGTSWTVTIRLDGDTEWQWSGCNAYPPLWKRFLKAINSLDLPNVK